MDEGTRIAAVEEVPDGSSFLFRVRDVESDETREAILVRADGDATDGQDDDGAGDDGMDGADDDAVEVEDDDAGRAEADETEDEAEEADDRGVAAWLNYCQHFTHIRLDKGSGVEFRGDELVCTNHGAMFDAGSGRCTYGPCEGAYLEAIDVTVRDGGVYLTDDGFEFEGAGPAERDPVDLGSKSNVEF